MSWLTSCHQGCLSPYRLVTPEETRLIDKRVEQKTPDSVAVLMRNVGIMAAQCIRQYFAPCHVLVACGPGNNGGDGVALAQSLARYGWPVTVTFWKVPAPGTLAEKQAAQWQGPIEVFSPAHAAKADLVVDALFGAGLSRSLPVEAEAFLAAAGKIVSLDLPSGLNGHDGTYHGGGTCPFQAVMTIALGYRRPAHVLLPTSSVCGRVVCVDIGLNQEVMREFPARFWLNHPSLWGRLPIQREDDHKYKRGVLALFGGGRMPGAALMAARAARRTGVGLVQIVAPDEALNFWRFSEIESIISAYTDYLRNGAESSRIGAWVCGPGLEESEVSALLPLLLERSRQYKGREMEYPPIIADAGALNWAKNAPEVLRGVAVITPHLGEFERLFGPIGGRIGKTRLDAVQNAAKILDAVIILKGADTLIAAPDGTVMVNRHATPALAMAGAGDVLCGVLGCLLAAGMPLWQAACAAVWIHGEAGRQAAQDHGGWPVIEDVIMALGRARECARECNGGRAGDEERADTWMGVRGAGWKRGLKRRRKSF